MSKFAIFGFVIQCCLLSVVVASESSAQGSQVKRVDEVIISVSFKETKLEDVFSKVSQLTDFTFTYHKKEPYLKERFTLNQSQISVEDLLIKIAIQTGLSFQQSNYNISVRKNKTVIEQAAGKVEILQDIKVSGKVTSQDDNKPLPGVSVFVKGTTLGTTTNLNGEYNLNVTNENAILVFSFIGYVKEEIPINGRSEIDIMLVSDIKQLSEVVVVGYGTVRKSDLTGSVVSLRQEDLNKGLNIGLEQALQGRAPGVQITQASAEPGGAVSVRIRGSSSINAGNEPLYVIDGLPVDNSSPITSDGVSFRNPPSRNPLSALNPSDISSIEILKDASATAIYGSRGANGVILITTKSGSEGKLKIGYNTSFSLSQLARKVDLLNTQDFIRVTNELEIARGNDILFSESDINSIGAGTDWQDAIMRTAQSHLHDLSFSGGSNSTQYYISLNYTDQEGIIKRTDFERYQARVNLNHQASEKFRFGLNLNTSFVKDQILRSSTGEVNVASDVVSTVLNAPPVFPIYNDDRTFYDFESGELFSVTLSNPLGSIAGEDIVQETNRTFGTFFTEYTVLPKLKARLNLGSDRTSSRRDSYRGRQTVQGALVGGRGNISNGELTNFLAELTLNYSSIFKEKHNFNVLAGYTYQSFRERSSFLNAEGFAADVIKTNSMGLGRPASFVLGSNRIDRSLLSYLGRINYNFNEKYLFTGTVRADGSSNFGENNRFGVFPSVSFAWRVIDEAFIPDGFLSDLKLRLGWGQIGNDNIGAGSALPTFAATGDRFTNGAVFGREIFTSLTAVRIPNPDLKWETTEQINIGIDLSLFKGRLSASVDYFNKTTKDLLLALPIPSTTGFSTITTNVGEVNNRGWEFLLSSKNLTKEFAWNSAFNLATLKNEVVNLGPINEIITGGLDASAILKPGEPMFSYFGFEAIGIFQTQEEVNNSAQVNTASPGDPIWNNLDDNNVINGNDRKILGNPLPNLTMGLSNDFSYKGLSLSIFIESALGHEMLFWGMNEALVPNDPFRNRLAEPLLNRWTPDNPSTQWPSAIRPASYQGGNTSSFSVLDASFVRLKNVQLSYQVPVKTSFIRSFSIFASGQNLAIITDYPGYDPDVNSTGIGNVRLDRGGYPAAKTYTIGLNIEL